MSGGCQRALRGEAGSTCLVTAQGLRAGGFHPGFLVSLEDRREAGSDTFRWEGQAGFLPCVHVCVRVCLNCENILPIPKSDRKA